MGAVLLDPVSVIEEAHSALEVVLSGLVPAWIEVAGDTDIHQAADAIRRSLIGLEHPPLLDGRLVTISHGWATVTRSAVI